MNGYVLYIVVFFAMLAAAVLLAVLGRFLWVRQVRSSLTALIGQREGLVAAARGVGAVLKHMAAESDEELALFASGSGSDDRRALEELAARMGVNAHELETLALPKRLWVVADLMQNAAETIASEAGRVGEAPAGGAVLEALAAIDLKVIADDMAAVNAELELQLSAFKVQDPAVYGGGLYI